MTSGFAFDGTKGFEENFEAFLDATREIDEELAEILQSNAAALADIVRGGERDSNARALFNTAIAEALDALSSVPIPPRED